MSIRTSLQFFGGLIAATLLGGHAEAHHSYAMFQKTQMILKGTVKDFEWTNPHAFLTVEVPDGKGGAVLWGAEAGGPAQLSRGGWKFNSLKTGDKITMGIAPVRNGAHGGGLIFVTEADGTRLSGGPLDRLLNNVGGGPGSPPGGPPGGPGGPKQ